MARFGVHRFGRANTMLVVDVQSDLLDEIATRVVIPLTLVTGAHREGQPRLKPTIEVAGSNYLLRTTEIAAVPRSSLGSVIANIEAAHRDTIDAALDFLFYGF